MAANTSGALHPAAAACGATLQNGVLADPKIRKIYDYWSSKFCDGALPARRDIDPVEIYDCLSVIMILDVVGDGGDFRIRLAGTLIEEAHDRALKGKRVSELAGEANMKPVMARFRQVVETRLPDFHSGSLAPLGRAFIEFDRVALPLADDGVTVSHLLCCYASRLRSSKS